MIDWYRVFRPSLWVRNYRTSEEWDALLNRLLDTHSVQVADDCTVKIGPVSVWVANYPYAYARPYKPHSIDVMPSGATLARFRRAEMRARLIKGSAPMNALRDIVLKATEARG